MLSDYFEQFCFMDKRTVNDGYGAVVVTYVDGAKFMAGISLNNSDELKVAMQNGLKTQHTVVIPDTMELHQDDIIKRMKDGLTLRVISESTDMHTPSVSTIQYSQVQAEVFRV